MGVRIVFTDGTELKYKNANAWARYHDGELYDIICRTVVKVPAKHETSFFGRKVRDIEQEDVVEKETVAFIDCGKVDFIEKYDTE